MELFQDLGLRNLIVIRVNPDKYKIKSTKINGCFKFDKKNNIICNEEEFSKRFNKLIEKIKHYRKNKPTQELTIEKLFFDRS